MKVILKKHISSKLLLWLKLLITLITSYAISLRYFSFFILASVSHLVGSVSEVDLKEILGDPLVHSFRSVPTFRSCPRLPCLVVSIILDATSFSNFCRDFRTNTVSSPLSLVEHYRNVHPTLMFAATLNMTPSSYLFFAHLHFFFSLSKTPRLKKRELLSGRRRSKTEEKVFRSYSRRITRFRR